MAGDARQVGRAAHRARADRPGRRLVTRDRFDAKYTALAPTLPGEAGRYANIPQPVMAQQMLQSFSIERQAGGDIIHGKPGDWLLQYAPGDYGIVEAAKFAKVYRPVD